MRSKLSFLGESLAGGHNIAKRKNKQKYEIPYECGSGKFSVPCKSVFVR